MKKQDGVVDLGEMRARARMPISVGLHANGVQFARAWETGRIELLVPMTGPELLAAMIDCSVGMAQEFGAASRRGQ